MTIDLLALRVACTLCGEYARIVAYDDPYDEACDQIGLFFAAHYSPSITAAYILVDGQPRTVPVKPGNHQETP